MVNIAPEVLHNYNIITIAAVVFLMVVCVFRVFNPDGPLFMLSLILVVILFCGLLYLAGATVDKNEALEKQQYSYIIETLSDKEILDVQIQEEYYPFLKEKGFEIYNTVTVTYDDAGKTETLKYVKARAKATIPSYDSKYHIALLDGFLVVEIPQEEIEKVSK